MVGFTTCYMIDQQDMKNLCYPLTECTKIDFFKRGNMQELSKIQAIKGLTEVSN